MNDLGLPGSLQLGFGHHLAMFFYYYILAHVSGEGTTPSHNSVEDCQRILGQ